MARVSDAGGGGLARARLCRGMRRQALAVRECGRAGQWRAGWTCMRCMTPRTQQETAAWGTQFSGSWLFVIMSELADARGGGGGWLTGLGLEGRGGGMA